MPSSSDQIRALMARWFPSADESHIADPVDVMDFLATHGFTETSGHIKLPTKSHTCSWDEMLCIRYLIEEWDYDVADSNYPEYPELTGLGS